MQQRAAKTFKLDASGLQSRFYLHVAGDDRRLATGSGTSFAAPQVTALVGRYHLVEDIFRVQILAVDERREAILATQAEEMKVREAARAAAADKEAANQNAPEA